MQQDVSSLERIIQEGGRGLSGGQCQMVLLSRLILRNPPIVLMDETRNLYAVRAREEQVKNNADLEAHLEDQLLIETRVNPRDIAYIRPGLPAIVKITAYDSSIYGDLNGEVESVSPDTLQDEVRRDHYYYRVYVRTLESGLTNKNGDRFAIVPGMMANVEIKTGQKSVLGYLIKPLNKVNEALRER